MCDIFENRHMLQSKVSDGFCKSKSQYLKLWDKFIEIFRDKKKYGILSNMILS